MAYLDCAAHSPLDPEVARFLADASGSDWGNPHNLSHTAGRRAAQAIDLARERVAALFGAPADAVTFTSGATEANNLAILGTAREFGESLRAVTTVVEHASVLEPFRSLEERATTRFLHVDAEGSLLEEELRELLTPQVNLVSILWVNNETGVVQPIGRIAEITRQQNIALHVDATQAVGRIDSEALWQSADMISVSAHKFGGPMGVGALIGGQEMLGPIMFGGHQQRGLRPGSLPTPLVAAFGVAADLRRQGFDEENSRLVRETAQLRTELGELGRIITPEHAAPGILCVVLDGIEAETLLAMLDDVALSIGSACSGGSIETSHVLQAMGISEAEANSAIRVSISAQTTSAEIKRGTARIREAVESLRFCAGGFTRSPTT